MRSASASVVTGLLYALGLILVGSFLTALLLAFTSLKESTLPYFTYAINLIGLLTGGLVTGVRCGSRGWYYGGLTGLSYFVLILLIGFLGFDAPLTWSALMYLAASFVVGAAGGAIGVNLGGNRR